MAGLTDLRVWQEAVALSADVVRAMRIAARPEVKSLTDRTILTAANVAEHIARSYGRTEPVGQRALYLAAKDDLLRLESQLAIARQVELLSAPLHAQMTARIQTVNRLLSGFLVYLDRQLGESAGIPRPDRIPALPVEAT